MLLGSLDRRANNPDLDLETERVSTNQLFERVVMSTTAIDHQNSTSEITIRPLSDALGAEIIDLNGAHQLDADTFELVRRALQEHHVLCFRNQDLADEELIEFSRQFGSLEALPEKDKTKGKKELYNVANVSIEGAHLPEDDNASSFSATMHAGTLTALTGIFHRLPQSCTASKCCLTTLRAERPRLPTCC